MHNELYRDASSNFISTFVQSSFDVQRMQTMDLSISGGVQALGCPVGDGLAARLTARDDH